MYIMKKYLLKHLSNIKLPIFVFGFTKNQIQHIVQSSFKFSETKNTIYYKNFINYKILRIYYQLRIYKIKQYIKYSNNNIYLLIQLLESRLDSTLFRIGACISILSARKLIRDHLVKVNNITVVYPSFKIYRGDIISCTFIKQPNKLKLNNLCTESPQAIYSSGNTHSFLILRPAILSDSYILLNKLSMYSN